MNKAAITLLIVTLLLMTVGVVMLFSTSAVYAKDRYGDAHYLLKRQLVWLLLGGLGCALAASVPYPKWRAYCPLLLILVMLLLAVVLVPGIGMKVGGARRWIDLRVIRFQPSEFAKLILVIWMAHWLAKEKRRLAQFGRGFAVPMGVVGLMLGLVFIEPDFGATALLAAVALGMMFLAGVPLRYLGPTVLLGAGGFAGMMMRDPERSQRFLAFVDLEKYKQGAGYQAWQAILAFGSGGWNGLGLGNSRQKMFYLPEAHTDFIFPIIGEELGLIGTALILLAFVLLLACAVAIALKAPDPFGQYLGLGIVLLLGIQTLINIGVVTAWLPTKGLPLPFISFGGSNLLVSLFCVGMLLSIYRYGVADAQVLEQEFLTRRQTLTP